MIYRVFQDGDEGFLLFAYCSTETHAKQAKKILEREGWTDIEIDSVMVNVLEIDHTHVLIR